MQFTADLLTICAIIKKALKAAGTDGYLTGGTLRDILLHRKPADIDLLITSNPLSVIRTIAQSLNTPYFPLKQELQIYRIATQDFTLDFSELHNATVHENLGQRDFTINSMAYPLLSLSQNLHAELIIDPYHGLHHLKNRIIHHTSQATFSFDPVRIVRAFRIAHSLRFTVSPETLRFIDDCASSLATAIPERIFAELMQIIAFQDSYKAISKMNAHRILDQIIPEIIPCRGCFQFGFHDFDVWNHCIATYYQFETLLNRLSKLFPSHHHKIKRYLCQPLSATINKKVALKFACLLHDIGKPPTKSLHKSGTRFSFIDHQKTGSIIAGEICKRLKFDSKSTLFITSLINNHLALSHYFEHSLITPLYFNRYFLKHGEDGIGFALIFIADKLSQKKNGDHEKPLLYVSKLFNYYYSDFHSKNKVTPLLNGSDIMKKFKLPPSPIIGKILHEVRLKQLDDTLKTKSDAFKFITKILKKIIQ